jgi:chorismate dehydratase
MQIGAVNYLNSKPLVYGLDRLVPDVRLCFDLPSRLADSLAAGRLDVALIPSVEFFRGPRYAIVSDACVACRGPVLSVKLYFRVPPTEVRCVALDDGSRTSAALTQILLAELCGVHPRWEPLPIGCGMDSTDADAVLLIGDRAIVSEERGARNEERETEAQETFSPQPIGPGPFQDVWDLGDCWTRWTGLPFVFAMWVARENTDLAETAAVLSAARDVGVRHLAQIAALEAPALPIPVELAQRYLRENLHFNLGRNEREGMRRFYQLCVAHGLAPGGLERTLGHALHDCPTQ